VCPRDRLDIDSSMRALREREESRDRIFLQRYIVDVRSHPS